MCSSIIFNVKRGKNREDCVLAHRCRLMLLTQQAEGVGFNCLVKQLHMRLAGISRAWGWEMLALGSHLPRMY